MKVEQIVLYLVQLPLLQSFETSFERISTKTAILAEVRAESLSGWGECVADRDPFYSPEDNTTAWHILEDYLIPEVLGKPSDTLLKHLEFAGKIRGNRMARGALASALWDLEAKRRGIPLWDLMGGSRNRVACGVSIGIQESPEKLSAKIAEEMAAGYQRIKIKIKPGWDLKILEHIRCLFPDIPLMADANSAYTLADRDRLRSMDQFGLLMLEQPLYCDDLYEHHLLQQTLETPVCLDESIRHCRDARAAVAMEACRIINIKPGRVGGPDEAIRIHDLCDESGMPVWCGGMIETGIGRAHNIALSTLRNFRMPGDISAPGRYFAEDIIDPEIKIDPGGWITPSNSPGIGYEPRKELIEKISCTRKVFADR